MLRACVFIFLAITLAWSPAAVNPAAAADVMTGGAERSYRELSRNGRVQKRVAGCMSLLGKIVNRFRTRLPSGVDPGEIYDGALDGLVSGVNDYDSSRGNGFGAYIRTKIANGILDGLRNGGRFKRLFIDRKKKWEAMHDLLASTLGSKPTEEDMAKGFGLTLEEYRLQFGEVMRASEGGTPSINADGDNRSEQGDLPRQAQYEDKTSTRNTVMITTRLTLDEAIARLSEDEQIVVRLHYYGKNKQVDIARILDVHPTHVCRLLESGREKLRGLLREEDFLDH